MNKKLSVVVPVYYNAQSLPELLTRLNTLKDELFKIDLDFEVIAVDDGSKDNSNEVLVDLVAKYNFLSSYQLTKNFGEATASKFGLRKVTGDAFSVLAADLQDPPELILDMANAWISGNSYVICERTKRNDPYFSKFLAKIYYKFLKVRKTGRRWLVALIKKCWGIAWDMWEDRNAENAVVKGDRLLKELHDKVSAEYSKG